ncbi:MAG: NADP-dependent malic enzyme [Bacilli bacterium]|nr:NADP-dependent malic enzyme [Bacilli bacterium]
MNYSEKALKAHREWRGKIEMKPRAPLTCKDELSTAYTPGVAAVCMAIHDDVNESFNLTRRWNTVPVITDGTAVLGLGDIGPEAGLPVMEGKSAIFKTFGDIDSYPLCIRTKDTEEIIQTIKLLAGSWGGINLEDISAPRCFEIETRLKEELDIPVFHDDQHGTAIVTLAATINALKLANKKIEDCKVVINGAGAAGIAICKFLMGYGCKEVIICNSKGIIWEGKEGLNAAATEISKVTNRGMVKGGLKEAMVGADIFVGVSGPNLVTKEMVQSMNEKPIVFPLANPVPEILPDLAKEAGAFIVGTGSSEYPNQVNNALVFPGLFRGAIDADARTVNHEMMVAASVGIANCVPAEELTVDNILPKPWDVRVHKCVAEEVRKACIASHATKADKK